MPRGRKSFRTCSLFFYSCHLENSDLINICGWPLSKEEFLLKSICKIRFHLLPFYLGRKMHALTLQGRRNWEAIDPLPHPPNYGRNNSKTTFSFKRPPSCIQTFQRSCLCSNTIVVILLVGVDKGQLISKCHFWCLQFS